MKELTFADRIKKWADNHSGVLLGLSSVAVTIGLIVGSYSVLMNHEQKQAINAARIDLQSICDHYKCSPEDAVVHVETALNEFKGERKYTWDRLNAFTNQAGKNSSKLVNTAIKTEREHAQTEK